MTFADCKLSEEILKDAEGVAHEELQRVVMSGIEK